MIGTRHHQAASFQRNPRRASIACEPLEGRQLLSTLGLDVARLDIELKVIHAGSSVTTAETKAVATDFAEIAAVAKKPSASSVTALNAEFQVIIKQGSITTVQAATLKKDVATVLTSAKVPTALAQQTATDLKTLVLASGVTKTEVKAVATDVKAIVADLSDLKN